jgi:hypothetical protein
MINHNNKGERMKKDKLRAERVQKYKKQISEYKRINDERRSMIKDTNLKIMELIIKKDKVIKKVGDKSLLIDVGDKRRHGRKQEVYDILDRCIKNVGDEAEASELIYMFDKVGISMQTARVHARKKVDFVSGKGMWIWKRTKL